MLKREKYLMVAEVVDDAWKCCVATDCHRRVRYRFGKNWSWKTWSKITCLSNFSACIPLKRLYVSIKRSGVQGMLMILLCLSRASIAAVDNWTFLVTTSKRCIKAHNHFKCKWPKYIWQLNCANQYLFAAKEHKNKCAHLSRLSNRVIECYWETCG